MTKGVGRRTGLTDAELRKRRAERQAHGQNACRAPCRYCKLEREREQLRRRLDRAIEACGADWALHLVELKAQELRDRAAEKAGSANYCRPRPPSRGKA